MSTEQSTEHPLYRDFSLSSRVQAAITLLIVGLALVGCAVFVNLGGQVQWNANGAYSDAFVGHTQDPDQYNHLADAFLAGSVSLDLPVSEVLLEMDNPYDTEMRRQLNPGNADPIYWDYAFYDGKYYCYFGAVPCLLTFLPYKAITGQNLPTDWAVLLFGWCVVLAGFLLVLQLQKTFFKRLSFYAFIIALFFFLASCGIWDQMFYARFYSVAIASSLAFALLGISCWLIAKRRLDDSRKANAWLVLGSACMALTLGCRPQLVLAALLSFPIFWGNIKRGQFFSRKGAGNTACIIAPFVVALIPVCWYNQARFDSPFDFGASYNLTGADMTSYSFSIFGTAFKTLEYLFMPIVPSDEFPFFLAVNTAVERFGLSGRFLTPEPFFAGAFALAPACLIVFALFGRSARKKLKEASALGPCLASIFVALMLIALAAHVSGVNARYFADFMWLLAMSAILTFWAISNAGTSRMVCNVMAAFVLLGFALSTWMFLAKERWGALWISHPELFDGIAGLFGSNGVDA